MKTRCMLCGKLIEEEVVIADKYDDDDDDDEIIRKKSSVFCVMCQAKLKNEADKGQKNPKPM
ncbi:MAG: hypothetical protein A4E52_01634 [Pelotomaculum sp. PtaB.Bin013]|uniref:DUF2197 domain-containing protein n=1 Tax=Pelotomaculum isophthalicicum JI TaxID=947010 RepID=A0A9X4H673_9FIRM|nr:hypothetical protein [Pelotomaculum isophthalicicum]MDF9408678.1 hypothetical protein [Pelotomaculum isophthalicicum JI]OPX85670.1 MAG: hypothetical protein A4E52_01634 [Pelotomaculum sp. PtaB.Bin013]